jgi:transcriptional regulator MftR-like protein
LFATAIAKRTGLPASDITVITFAGAVGGALLAAMLASVDALEEDFVGVIDAALAYLEAGMPL